MPLGIADGQGAAQFRISLVQILNWGAYSGLQTMTVARSGTVIVGPSGRGKSTLLDAMASVILPNPQEFNQAARDDRGKKRERTVYSYARGHTTDQRQDENGRSATTYYLLPTTARRARVPQRCGDHVGDPKRASRDLVPAGMGRLGHRNS